MTVLRSRSNSRILHWRRLIVDRQARRRARRAWIEGTRLVAAYIDAHGPPVTLVLSTQAQRNRAIDDLVRRANVTPVVLADALFADLADTETPQGIAAEIDVPAVPAEGRDAERCVFLDGVRDPGNLGAILRSAAAFGIADVVFGRGCADPWAPKVLRAAMGAHFALRLEETSQLRSRIAAFDGQRLCTVPRGGTPLHEIDLSGRHAWIFGGEGQGVDDALAAIATLHARIPMAKSAESLNVAVAAAICLYESARQRRVPDTCGQ